MPYFSYRRLSPSLLRQPLALRAITPRPGRIEKIIAIDLPRPRDKAVVASPRFAQYCEEITECFMRYGVIRY